MKGDSESEEELWESESVLRLKKGGASTHSQAHSQYLASHSQSHRVWRPSQSQRDFPPEGLSADRTGHKRDSHSHEGRHHGDVTQPFDTRKKPRLSLHKPTGASVRGKPNEDSASSTETSLSPGSRPSNDALSSPDRPVMHSLAMLPRNRRPSSAEVKDKVKDTDEAADISVDHISETDEGSAEESEGRAGGVAVSATLTPSTDVTVEKAKSRVLAWTMIRSSESRYGIQTMWRTECLEDEDEDDDEDDNDSEPDMGLSSDQAPQSSAHCDQRGGHPPAVPTSATDTKSEEDSPLPKLWFSSKRSCQGPAVGASGAMSAGSRSSSGLPPPVAHTAHTGRDGVQTSTVTRSHSREASSSDADIESVTSESDSESEKPKASATPAAKGRPLSTARVNPRYKANIVRAASPAGRDCPRGEEGCADSDMSARGDGADFEPNASEGLTEEVGGDNSSSLHLVISDVKTLADHGDWDDDDTQEWTQPADDEETQLIAQVPSKHAEPREVPTDQAILRSDSTLPYQLSEDDENPQSQPLFFAHSTPRQSAGPRQLTLSPPLLSPLFLKNESSVMPELDTQPLASAGPAEPFLQPSSSLPLLHRVSTLRSQTSGQSLSPPQLSQAAVLPKLEPDAGTSQRAPPLSMAGEGEVDLGRAGGAESLPMEASAEDASQTLGWVPAAVKTEKPTRVESFSVTVGIPLAEGCPPAAGGTVGEAWGGPGQQLTISVSVPSAEGFQTLGGVKQESVDPATTQAAVRVKQEPQTPKLEASWSAEQGAGFDATSQGGSGPAVYMSDAEEDEEEARGSAGVGVQCSEGGAQALVKTEVVEPTLDYTLETDFVEVLDSDEEDLFSRFTQVEVKEEEEDWGEEGQMDEVHSLWADEATHKRFVEIISDDDEVSDDLPEMAGDGGDGCRADAPAADGGRQELPSAEESRGEGPSCFLHSTLIDDQSAEDDCNVFLMDTQVDEPVIYVSDETGSGPEGSFAIPCRQSVKDEPLPCSMVEARDSIVVLQDNVDDVFMAETQVIDSNVEDNVDDVFMAETQIIDSNVEDNVDDAFMAETQVDSNVGASRLHEDMSGELPSEVESWAPAFPQGPGQRLNKQTAWESASCPKSKQTAGKSMPEGSSSQDVVLGASESNASSEKARGEDLLKGWVDSVRRKPQIVQKLQMASAGVRQRRASPVVVVDEDDGVESLSVAEDSHGNVGDAGRKKAQPEDRGTTAGRRAESNRAGVERLPHQAGSEGDSQTGDHAPFDVPTPVIESSSVDEEEADVFTAPTQRDYDPFMALTQVDPEIVSSDSPSEVASEATRQAEADRNLELFLDSDEGMGGAEGMPSPGEERDLVQSQPSDQAEEAAEASSSGVSHTAVPGSSWVKIRGVQSSPSKTVEKARAKMLEIQQRNRLSSAIEIPALPEKARRGRRLGLRQKLCNNEDDHAAAPPQKVVHATETGQEGEPSSGEQRQGTLSTHVDATAVVGCDGWLSKQPGPVGPKTKQGQAPASKGRLSRKRNRAPATPDISEASRQASRQLAERRRKAIMEPATAAPSRRGEVAAHGEVAAARDDDVNCDVELPNTQQLFSLGIPLLTAVEPVSKERLRTAGPPASTAPVMSLAAEIGLRDKGARRWQEGEHTASVDPAGRDERTREGRHSEARSGSRSERHSADKRDRAKSPASSETVQGSDRHGGSKTGDRSAKTESLKRKSLDSLEQSGSDGHHGRAHKLAKVSTHVQEDLEQVTGKPPPEKRKNIFDQLGLELTKSKSYTSDPSVKHKDGDQSRSVDKNHHPRVEDKNVSRPKDIDRQRSKDKDKDPHSKSEVKNSCRAKEDLKSRLKGKDESRPEAKKDHKPKDKEESRPKDRKDHKPEDKDESRPKDRKDHKPEDKDESRSKERKDHKPKDKEESRPKERKDHKPKDKEESRPKDRKDHKPEDKDESRPEDKKDHKSKHKVDPRPKDKGDSRPKDKVDSRAKDEDDFRLKEKSDLKNKDELRSKAKEKGEPRLKERDDPKLKDKVDSKPRDKVDSKPRDKDDSKPRDKGDSKPRDKDDSKPRDKGDSKPRDKDDSKPRDKGDSKPRDKDDSKPRDKGDSKPRDKDDSKPRDKGDSKPRDKDDSKPRDKGDSKPRDKGDSKPRDKDDSKPRDKGDSKPREKFDPKAKDKGDPKPKDKGYSKQKEKGDSRGRGDPRSKDKGVPGPSDKSDPKHEEKDDPKHKVREDPRSKDKGEPRPKDKGVPGPSDKSDHKHEEKDDPKHKVREDPRLKDKDEPRPKAKNYSKPTDADHLRPPKDAERCKPGVDEVTGVVSQQMLSSVSGDKTHASSGDGESCSSDGTAALSTSVDVKAAAADQRAQVVSGVCAADPASRQLPKRPAVPGRPDEDRKRRASGDARSAGAKRVQFYPEVREVETDGVVVTRALTPSTVTLPSLQDMLAVKTGPPPVVRNPMLKRLPPLQELQMQQQWQRLVPQPVVPTPALSRPGSEAGTSAGLLEPDALMVAILSWSPHWLLEYENQMKKCAEGRQSTASLPPLFEMKQLYPLVSRYTNIIEYQHIFFKLLLLETWEDIFQRWREKRIKTKAPCCQVLLTDRSKLGTFPSLGWIGLLSRESRQRGLYPAEGDMVRVNMVGHSMLDQGQQQETTRSQLAHVERSNVSPCPNLPDLLAKYPYLQSHPILQTEDKDLYVLRLTTKSKYRKFAPSSRSLIGIEPVATLIPAVRRFSALQQFPRSRSHLMDQVLSPSTDAFRMAHIPAALLESNTGYNVEQSQAIAAMLDAVRQPPSIPRVCLLQGPPGTGKSHVITGFVLKTLRTVPGARVCLATPSNAAVDELLRRLIKHKQEQNQDYSLVRIGNPDSAHSDVKHFVLDNKVKVAKERELHRKRMSLVPQSVRAHYETLCKTLADMRNSVNKAQASEKEIRKKHQELDVLAKQLEEAGKDVRLSGAEIEALYVEALLEAQVVCGTLSSFGQPMISRILRKPSDGSRQQLFTCIIIDEATQATELDCLIPLQYGCSKLFLVGDPDQLPPTVLSPKAQTLNYGLSLFERLYKNFDGVGEGGPVMMLRTQYRMDPAICSFPNAYVYKGLLRTDTSVSRKCHNFPLLPYMLFDLEESQELLSQSGTLSNEVEAEGTAVLCQELIKGGPRIKPQNVGIICPYSGQKRLVHKKLNARGLGGVEVNTVDGFQGREKHVIILSCVRARSSTGGIGFMADIRRMNVALTRAKYALYITAHLSSLRADSDWTALIKDAERREPGAIQKVRSVDQFPAIIRHSCFKPEFRRRP